MEKCIYCDVEGCIGKERHFEYCTTCEGAGGWDRSKDVEVYDDWIDCPDCEGTGEIAI